MHRRPYSDTNLLLECFTAAGRFPAIARVSTSSKSRTAGLLQPFTPLWIQWKGKGEVVSLYKYEQISQPYILKDNALLCGFYLNELLTRLLQRNDPFPDVFQAYSDTLEALAAGSEIDPLLRRFELRLLDNLGYGIDLRYTYDTGEPVEEDGYYTVAIEQGLSRADYQTEQTLSGKTLLALSNDQELEPALWREARNFTRKMLNHYLGPTPLKSRELFRKKF
ncbi:MAG: DNA repair protein RecO [Chromatiales bacterium]|nr:DNA repair protein RecO [Chromatiales bacterium]